MTVSPTPGSPLREVAALSAKGRPVAVAGMDHRVIRKDVEDAFSDIVEELGETRRVLLRVPQTSGEEGIAGEHMRRAPTVPGEKGDRAGCVPAEGDHLKAEPIQLEDLTMSQGMVDGNGEVSGVLCSCGGSGTGGRDDGFQGTDVIPMRMGSHHHPESSGVFGVSRTPCQQVRDGWSVIGGVDQYLVPRTPCGEQIHVIVHLGDRNASDREGGKLGDVIHGHSLGAGKIRATAERNVAVRVMAAREVAGMAEGIPAWLAVNPSSSVPPFEQLRLAILDAANSGRAPVGTRLPPVRALAAHLGVAVNTAARAYRELEQAGIVETRSRAGTVVAAAGDETRRRGAQAAAAYAQVVLELGISDKDALAYVQAALRRA